jgi:hypothetical protein
LLAPVADKVALWLIQMAVEVALMVSVGAAVLCVTASVPIEAHPFVAVTVTE